MCNAVTIDPYAVLQETAEKIEHIRSIDRIPAVIRMSKTTWDVLAEFLGGTSDMCMLELPVMFAPEVRDGAVTVHMEWA